MTKHGLSLTISRTLALGAAVLFLVSCAPGSSSEDPGSGGTKTPPEGTEKPYSAAPISYSGNITTVTGTATYARFEDANNADGDGLSSNEGLKVTTTRPIRYAEVHILDAAGTIIQAGETNGTGGFSMLIPRTAGSYTLRVNSRADNSFLRASVLNNPYDKTYYSLTKAFSLAGSETTMPLTITPAPYNSTLEGGAFNILDDVYIANQFLREKGNETSPCTICANDFVSAPKVQIYWTKGVSPGVYFGAADVPISFFAPTSGGGVYRGLYILGGVEGSVCTDTDHFDNSVILHEYGHFLEDAYGKSASPGGSHDGNSMIDPRLAWSEGWADFFQGAALGRAYYRDTSKNSECTGGQRLSFPDFNLESKSGSDVPTANEGIFRELSIARTLYDTMTGSNQGTSYNMTNNTDSVAADRGFAQIWHIFKSIGTSGNYFQNAGMFNLGFYNMLAAAPFSMTFPNVYAGNATSVLDYERQAANRNLYGSRLNPTAGAEGSCMFSITAGVPYPDEIENGVVVASDPLTNNDFYEYYYDGSADRAIVQLKYRKNGSGSTPYDLDLFAYSQGYVYMDYSTMAASSEKTYPETGGDATYLGREVINLTGQPAGVYMINVRVDYQAARETTQYFLQNPNGAQLCQ